MTSAIPMTINFCKTPLIDTTSTPITFNFCKTLLKCRPLPEALVLFIIHP